MAGDAQMSAHHIDEQRIALGGPDRGGLSDDPKQETGEPQPQAEAECRRQRAVEDRDRARRTAEQDRLGQRAMNGREKPAMGQLPPSDQHPAAEREERQEEGSLRTRSTDRTRSGSACGNPPEVSPNASVRPVTMMMMTAMILATGPSTDCRI